MNFFSTDLPYPRGEIQMKGPNVFKGYFKREDLTKAAFDDGWFSSGDVGMIYPNGSLAIIGRVKEQFKLSQGEYVAPAKLEGVYGLSNLIGQCFVYGNSLKSNTVMIVIIDDNTQAWAKENNLPTDLAVLSSSPELHKAIQAEVQRLSKLNSFNSFEIPKEIHISDQAFTVENDCLTPTFKMKRNGIQAFFQPQIDEMYVKIDKALADRDAKQ